MFQPIQTSAHKSQRQFTDCASLPQILFHPILQSLPGRGRDVVTDSWRGVRVGIPPPPLPHLQFSRLSKQLSKLLDCGSSKLHCVCTSRGIVWLKSRLSERWLEPAPPSYCHQPSHPSFTPLHPTHNQCNGKSGRPMEKLIILSQIFQACVPNRCGMPWPGVVQAWLICICQGGPAITITLILPPSFLHQGNILRWCAP